MKPIKMKTNATKTNSKRRKEQTRRTHLQSQWSCESTNGWEGKRRYTAVFSVVTQCSSPQRGGALRDDTKNGCVADYANYGL